MNTTRTATSTLTLMVGVTAGLLLARCASTRVKRLSGPELMRQAQQMEAASNFSWNVRTR